MSIKNRTDLNAQVDVLFPDNSTQFITAAKVREHLMDLDDSAINLLGDLSIQGKLGYSTILTISSNGDIPHKKYVDDADLLLYALNGSRPITANFNVGGYNLTNVNQILGSGNVVVLDGVGVTIGAATGLDVSITSSSGDINLVSSSLSASTVPYIDASNNLVSSAVTPTQLSYLDATSSIQTQLNSKGSGTITSVSGTSNRITSTGGATPGIDISASYVGQSSITTVGTIGTGVWQGTQIATAYIADNAVTYQKSYNGNQLSIISVLKTLSGN